MAIKKDDTGRRWVEMELTVPGTPEEVWQAIATGNGNTGWFTKTTIEERVGGALRFDFGANGASAGEITAWEPPSKIEYVERDWSPGAPPVATEITVTARDGARCVVRMVHTFVTTSDQWDDLMEGFETGWPSFFDVLRVYLAHFAGRPAAQCLAIVPAGTDGRQAWKRLVDALGLAGADAGETRAITAAPQPLTGVVEKITQQARERILLMRVEAPGPGIAMFAVYEMAPGTVQVSVTHYFYGDDAAARAADAEPRWRDWLTERFPAPADAEA
jgi:uncharacterized protein YndB with AHSA1/START domain